MNKKDESLRTWGQWRDTVAGKPCQTSGDQLPSGCQLWMQVMSPCCICLSYGMGLPALYV
jgi:hypothetical protein